MGLDLIVAARRFFVAAWQRCSEEGWFDETNGEEFRRVILEWFAADVPYDVVGFILQRAYFEPDPPS